MCRKLTTHVYYKRRGSIGHKIKSVKEIKSRFNWEKEIRELVIDFLAPKEKYTKANKLAREEKLINANKIADEAINHAKEICSGNDLDMYNAAYKIIKPYIMAA